MRTMILKIAAAVAVVTASAAPAVAGGFGLFSGGCSPCSQSYSQSYGYGQGYSTVYQQLPDPAHQYYYVNQGPTFSGPGNFAPTQFYQETSTPGWTGYERGDGDFDGGQYAGGSYGNYGTSYEQPYRHAAVQYSYQPRVRAYGFSQRGYAPRHSYRSYAPRYGYHHRRFAGPRVMYAPRYASRHHQYQRYQRPLRRMY
jgi:hypothetical protein